MSLITYGTKITNFINITNITLVTAITYGTKITNFTNYTNFTNITLVSAFAYGTPPLAPGPLAPQMMTHLVMEWHPLMRYSIAFSIDL